ncbi:unnamed protein product [Calicophoron daubneyi]|uniref:Uncharacterized protein n=1 Tax=Calicophoron daubneyi TaxID=300641 RepID=A0AAV2SZA6_CALDB
MSSSDPHEHYYDNMEDNMIPTGIEALGTYDDLSRGETDSAAVLHQRAQYAEELKQVEDEIQTLRQVLAAKYRRQSFLKHQLGISMISELKEEVNKGMDNLRTSEAYQKTTAAVKKTSSVLQEKWNILRHTSAYKSVEDKLTSAYSTVRGKLVGPSAPVSEGRSAESSVSEPNKGSGSVKTIETSAKMPQNTSATTVAVVGVNSATDNKGDSPERSKTPESSSTSAGGTGVIKMEPLSTDEEEQDDHEEFKELNRSGESKPETKPNTEGSPRKPKKTPAKKRPSKPKSFAD